MPRFHSLLDPPFLAQLSGAPAFSCYSPGAVTTVYTGNVTVTDQASLDVLAGYDGLLGDLSISVDGLDWSPLADLVEVDGAVTFVVPSPVAGDLPALPALRYISGAFTLYVSATIAVLPDTFAPVLARVGSLELGDGLDLTTMTGVFPALSCVDTSLRIDFDGQWPAPGGAVNAAGAFPGLRRVGGQLGVYGNDVTTFDLTLAFPALDEMTGSLRFDQLPGLDLTDAFPALVSADGGAYFGAQIPPSNTVITSVTGAFPVCQRLGTEFGNGLTFQNLGAGSLVPLFPALTEVGSLGVVVEAPNAVTGLTGSLAAVAKSGGVSVTGAGVTGLDNWMPALTQSFGISVSACDNLTSVAGAWAGMTGTGAGYLETFALSDCAALTAMSALANWTSEFPATSGVRPLVTLANNGALVDLSGLSGLVTVASLTIDGNAVLDDLTQLYTLNGANSDPGDSVAITNNPSLPTVAQAQALINHLVGEGFTGTTSESGNGPG